MGKQKKKVLCNYIILNITWQKCTVWATKIQFFLTCKFATADYYRNSIGEMYAIKLLNMVKLILSNALKDFYKLH